MKSKTINYSPDYDDVKMDIGALRLFTDEPRQIYKSRFKKVNPMVLRYGQLEGKTCKDCLYLEYHHGGNKYFTKCRLRGVTHGAGTDHLVNWEACNRWEAEDDRT